MSDCHRGDGNWNDNFSANGNIYYAALNYYYRRQFTYFELGDGDELWENRRLSDIIETHSNVYWMLYKFMKDNRAYFICGNHDKVKLNHKYFERNIMKAAEDTGKDFIKELKRIRFYESIVLTHDLYKRDILLIHGHQGDFLNDYMWASTRFMVRYLWQPLESYGVKDPTRTGKNYKRRQDTENRISRWVKDNKCMVIAGHTHRPVFPKTDGIPYFNDGSCVHPRCITAIEIEQGFITLVKWQVQTGNSGVLYIGKEILAGPERLNQFITL